MTDRIRVLVVDDSAFARKVVREVLSSADDIDVVGIARNGFDALERVAELKPDVVALDLMMPELDGVGVIEALQSASHRPAIVIVSMTDQNSELGIAALSRGAIDIVQKPTALATDRLYELGDELRAKVRLAAKSRARTTLAPVRERVVAKGAATVELVVIGASTGGPQALTMLLHALPKDFGAPIAIVVHLPEGYTEAFARRLDIESPLEVLEAREGLSLEAGRVVVARAGIHLNIDGQRHALTCHLSPSPRTAAHRPSVDALFETASRITANATLGVVLTGMGSDGLAGARAIREAHGRVLTEHEDSCVVYGMPRAVFDAGLSNGAASIENMASLIVHSL